jgi:hypothetical protein
VGQKCLLTGTWIDTYSNYSFILKSSNMGEIDAFRYLSPTKYEIIGDTFRLQSRSFRHPDMQEFIYNYDFKIINCNDSLLRIEPISSYALRIFDDGMTRDFINQNYLKDNDFKFIRITFEFWAYTIEIDSTRQVNLKVTEGWSEVPGGTVAKSKTGYFKGFLTVDKYDKLISILKSINIRNLKFRHDFTMSHSDYKRYSIAYNDKVFRESSQRPPLILQSLNDFLLELCEEHNFERTQEGYIFKK